MTKDGKLTTTTMPTKSYADATSPTTETLDRHGFTQMKASKSPGRKKETNADKGEANSHKKPLRCPQQRRGRPSYQQHGGRHRPPCHPGQNDQEEKPTKKSRAQIKAAYMEKAKATAAAQARQIDDLPNQPGATITAPPARKSTGRQRGGTKGSGSGTQDMAGGQPMEEKHDATPCTNCLEICKNGKVADDATDLICCFVSCHSKHDVGTRRCPEPGQREHGQKRLGQ